MGSSMKDSFEKLKRQSNGLALVWVQSPPRGYGPRYFTRVPVVGEEFEIRDESEQQFTCKVTRVVHIAFPEGDSDAEVEAVEIADPLSE